MAEQAQVDLFGGVTDLDLARLLLADLHDDLVGKIARSRQLADLSEALSPDGTLLTGGQVTFAVWTEARASFIHGHFIATVMLCQSLAEHILASYLELALGGQALPDQISFTETLGRCVSSNFLDAELASELKHLMRLRNPLSHYRSIDDPRNLTRRSINTTTHAEDISFGDASFAIRVAVRLLALPQFRLGR